MGLSPTTESTSVCWEHSLFSWGSEAWRGGRLKGNMFCLSAYTTPAMQSSSWFAALFEGTIFGVVQSFVSFVLVFLSPCCVSSSEQSKPGMDTAVFSWHFP